MSPPPFLVDGPADATWTVIFAHGAGAPMDTPFMQGIAQGLSQAGHRVVRFEFPYMRRRRTEGLKAGPDRMPKLLDAFREAVAAHPASRVALAGKSMGGRVATHLAAEVGADAVLVFGYPFHPPGKPERTRTEHLVDQRVPTLILQGERDPFGRPDEVAGYGLPASLRVHWLADGDHSFKPRKASGHTLQGHLATACEVAHDFLQGL